MTVDRSVAAAGAATLVSCRIDRFSSSTSAIDNSMQNHNTAVTFVQIIIIYLPRLCKCNNNDSEQTVGQDSKATQDALTITAHKNYATQKKHRILTNTSELNKIHPVYLPNKT